MHDDDDPWDDWDEGEVSVRVWSSGGYHPWSDAFMDFTRAVTWGVGFAFGATAFILLTLIVRAAVLFLV